MTITEKIRKLCEANNITINKLEKELGIGRGNIGRWYKHRPNPDDLLKVSSRFNVSAEYLLSGESSLDIQLFAEKNPALDNENGMDDVTRELINLAYSLNDSDRALLLEMARSIKRRSISNE